MEQAGAMAATKSFMTVRASSVVNCGLNETAPLLELTAVFYSVVKRRRSCSGFLLYTLTPLKLPLKPLKLVALFSIYVITGWVEWGTVLQE